jgi:MFS family permease
MLKGKHDEAKQVIAILFDENQAQAQLNDIESSLSEKSWSTRERFGFLAAKAMRFPLMIGVILAIAQQITGINVIFFYAPTIFEQSGVGTNAAFMQAVWIGIANVVFTIVAMATIDRWGRKPLLIVGLCGVIISMAICAYGFNNATYTLTNETVVAATQNMEGVAQKIASMVNQTYYSDVSFKQALLSALSQQEYDVLQQSLLSGSISMNAPLVLFGIIAFVASFAVSLGPVMWAMLAEIYPNQTRGLAISLVGVINALTSFVVQLVFPWELMNFGAAITFALYGAFAVISLFLVVRYFPETKGRTLEEISLSLASR